MKARTPLFLVLLALALVAPAAAAAAPALNLDPNGHRPHVVVSGAGSGFFTWTSNDVFRYCRIAQGGAACNATKSYSQASTIDTEGGYTLLTPAGVMLLDARCCSPYAHKVLFRSNDGGTTFPTTVNPGDMN
ncbi:MAG: hypothetical protein QOG86_1745, partial [Thermoleophilaceae bacterium]|nr:hypothetical protein [Thermoleophilaceae bacterium]